MISSTIASIAPLSETWYQPFGFDDAVGIATFRPHGAEYFLGCRVGDGAVGDALEHATELLRRDRTLLHFQAVTIQLCTDFADQPVGAQLGLNPSRPPLVRGGAGFPPDKGGLRGVKRCLEEIRHLARSREDASIVGR